MTRPGYVYLLANRRLGTLYLGVTSDLIQRVWQHRTKAVPGFTERHGCTRLMWFTAFDDIQDARYRELQMKRWKRAWKIVLIEEGNPDWRGLWHDIVR